MPLTAIIFIFLFAIVHTTWSLIAKRAPKTAAFYAVTILAGAALYSPLCAPHIAANSQILRAWPFFCISGTFLAVYYVLMAAAYRRADLSVAYPLLRLGPVFIAAWSVVFLNEKLPAAAAVGIAAVVAGGMLLPQKSLRITRETFSPRRYLNKIYALALAASLSTSIYVVLDKFAMTRFNPEGSFRLAFDYVFLEMCACCIVLAAFACLSKDKNAWRQLAAAKLEIILIAPMLIGAYVLVMAALAIPGVRAAYVGAFRHVSVVITVVAGVVILKERFGRVRIVASLIIFAGLLLMMLMLGNAR